MPKSVDRDRKRAEFVAASWDVIASEGLRAATLRRVAQSAGCTTGALTHYFADRRALLIDALRSAHDQAAARMVVTASGLDTVGEQLEAVALEALPLDEARLREWRVWLAFWSESMNDSELAAENARRYAEWQELLEGLVGRVLADEGQVGREVAHLIALIDGLGLRLARQRTRGRQLAAEREVCEATIRRAVQQLQGQAGRS